MGLEALSRGANGVVFFEFDRGAAAILRRNIAGLKVGERTQVVVGDLFSWMKSAPKPARRANLLFLDPPYRFVREKPGELRELAKALADRHLASEATVVFRHDRADDLDLAPLRRYDQRNYGSMAVEFLTCPCIPTSISPPPTQPG
jgi:16S rRNA (guanine966-N2)-methyltransferase